MMHMLSLSDRLGMPLDPLMAGCLRSVAKWQVSHRLTVLWGGSWL